MRWTLGRTYRECEPVGESRGTRSRDRQFVTLTAVVYPFAVSVTAVACGVLFDAVANLFQWDASRLVGELGTVALALVVSFMLARLLRALGAPRTLWVVPAAWTCVFFVGIVLVSQLFVDGISVYQGLSAAVAGSLVSAAVALASAVGLRFPFRVAASTPVALAPSEQHIPRR